MSFSSLAAATAAACQAAYGLMPGPTEPSYLGPRGLLHRNFADKRNPDVTLDIEGVQILLRKVQSITLNLSSDRRIYEATRFSFGLLDIGYNRLKLPRGETTKTVRMLADTSPSIKVLINGLPTLTMITRHPEVVASWERYSLTQNPYSEIIFGRGLISIYGVCMEAT